MVSVYAEVLVNLFRKNNNIVSRINEYLVMVVANIWIVFRYEEGNTILILGILDIDN